MKDGIYSKPAGGFKPFEADQNKFILQFVGSCSISCGIENLF